MPAVAAATTSASPYLRYGPAVVQTDAGAGARASDAAGDDESATISGHNWGGVRAGASHRRDRLVPSRPGPILSSEWVHDAVGGEFTDEPGGAVDDDVELAGRLLLRCFRSWSRAYLSLWWRSLLPRRRWRAAAPGCEWCREQHQQDPQDLRGDHEGDVAASRRRGGEDGVDAAGVVAIAVVHGLAGPPRQQHTQQRAAHADREDGSSERQRVDRAKPGSVKREGRPANRSPRRRSSAASATPRRRPRSR